MYNPQKVNNIISSKYDNQGELSQRNYNFQSDSDHFSTLQNLQARQKLMNEQTQLKEQKYLLELKNNQALPNTEQYYHKSSSNYSQLNSQSKSNIGNSQAAVNSSSKQSQNQNINEKKFQLNQEEVIISIEGFKFLPQSLYVHCGTKLIWQVKINKSTYNSLYDKTGPRFFIVSIPQLEEESPPIHENESYSYVIDKIGTFDITCPNYTRMKGQLIVVDRSTTLSDLANELQSKVCFMGHIDEFKYSSQNQLNSQKLLNTSKEPMDINKQIFQSKEQSSLYLNENLEKNEQIFNPLQLNDKIITNIENNKISYNLSIQNSKISSDNKNQQSQANNIIPTDIQIESKNDQSCFNKNTFNDKSIQNEQDLIQCDLTKQSSKQEKILSKLIDSDDLKNQESEQIAKQFMQELQEEQNNQPNKKKNTHYLQLYKDDFYEDIDEDEDDENKKKNKLDMNNKYEQLLNIQLTPKRINQIQEVNNIINKEKQQIILLQNQKIQDPQKHQCLSDNKSNVVLSYKKCVSSSQIEQKQTFQAIGDKFSTQTQLQSEGQFNKISTNKNVSMQVKQIKKQNSSDKEIQNNEPIKSLQNEKTDGYRSDCDNRKEEEEIEKERNQIERRKNVLLLKQGSNPNNLYFRGHNYQFKRNYQKSNGIGIEDEDGEEDDYQYDCSTIISEEDASAYTSKDNSLYRRNNSSTNLYSSGNRKIKQNINPNNSFSASQNFNKQHFTKRRNYCKKPKIGGLSENYLKSPAQSILTTAESSKYSDTTKQLSQKGDFELEGTDIHERGYLLFKHKYSQKRRASTDQTISESRQNNNNEDSDTRSIKSLKTEPNIINNSNLNPNNVNNLSNNPNVFGYVNASCSISNSPNIQKNMKFQNDENTNQQSFECHTDSDNESEYSDLFTQYCLQNLEQNCIGQNSQKYSNLINQQPKTQFLTQNINKQEEKNKNISHQKQDKLESYQENQQESESLSSLNTAQLLNGQKTQNQQKENKKLIDNYVLNTQNIQSELEQIQNNLPQTNQKNEQIQQQIQFTLSFLEQRFEIESWLAQTFDDQGEIEDY